MKIRSFQLYLALKYPDNAEGVKAKSHGDLVVFEVVDSTKMAEDIPETPAAEEDAAAEPEIVGAKEKAEKAAEREEAKKK